MMPQSPQDAFSKQAISPVDGMGIASTALLIAFILYVATTVFGLAAGQPLAAVWGALLSTVTLVLLYLPRWLLL